MIINLVMVNVYVDSDMHQRGEFKDELMNTLHWAFGMTLTYSQCETKLIFVFQPCQMLYIF